MALPQWTVANNYSLGTLNERVTVSIDLPLSTTTGITTTIVSGQLPSGLRLSENTIIGTPQNVSKATTFRFCVRASNSDGIADRTFTIIVEGADVPEWITSEGSLPVGPNSLYFILESSPIDFQLIATDEDLPTGQTLEYFIADGDGTLPPGITLTKDGKLQGVVDPLPRLDINEIKLGYDAGSYSANVYDWGAASEDTINLYYGEVDFTNLELVRPPRKLNRRYPFIVTVADDTSFAKRQFEIYVVADDFARADNTILEADTNVFTADVTYLRNPIWLTPENLGVKRANNYTTVFLETLKQPDVTGAIKYIFKQTNPGYYKLITTGETVRGFYELSGQLPNFPKSNRGPDSVDDAFQPDPVDPSEWQVITPETPSSLPMGLQLDPDSGELAGIVPYQPSITKEYNFTIGAFRYDEDTGLVTVFATYYQDQLAGTVNLRVAKLPLGMTDGIDDLNDLVGQEVEVEGRKYNIISANSTNIDYDVLVLDRAIQPLYSIDPLIVVKQADSGQNYFFVQLLSQKDKDTYKGKDIRYSDTESYKISDVHPYNKYEVYTNTSNIELRTDVMDFDTDFQTTVENYLLDQTGREAYTEIETNIGGVTKVTIFVSSTSATNTRSFIANMFHTTDSSTVKVDLLTTFDRVKLSSNLTRTLPDGRYINFGVFRGGSFNKTFSVVETDLIETLKTFTIKILGEADSVITWLTPSAIGTIKANRISNFRVFASTTLPEGKCKYQLISGTLPYGFTLKENGEIIGKVPSVGTETNPGVTKIDNNTTTFDGNTTSSFATGATSFDRIFRFTVRATDRLGYSEVDKEFYIQLDSTDSIIYSNLYMKPFLPVEQRTLLSTLTNNIDVFDPKVLYRPSDPNFGVQKELKSLVFAGIETTNIREYVAATATNHKRKSYLFGNVKTAQAKYPGSDEVLYEVVYVELIDPAKPTTGRTRDSFVSVNKGRKITVDSVELESIDDINGGGITGVYLAVLRKDGTTFRLSTSGNTIEVLKRNGTVISLSIVNEIGIITKDGGVVSVTITTETGAEQVEEWNRFRPVNTTIKADNSAITVSEDSNSRHYISNIDNMRDNINSIGVKSKEFLPLWMQTAQPSELKELGYTFAVPLAYVQPGNAEQIRLNVENYIKTSSFDFNKINYDIDRYIIDTTENSSEEQYIVFANYSYNA